jgi:hypothetical protein
MFMPTEPCKSVLQRAGLWRRFPLVSRLARGTDTLLQSAGGFPPMITEFGGNTRSLSTLIGNQINWNANRQRLPHTFLRALAGVKGAVKRNAKTGTS